MFDYNYAYSPYAVHTYNVYHYIFDVNTYNALVNKQLDYLRVEESSYIKSAKRLIPEILERSRAKAEKMLHEVALLNLQYATLCLNFCLCIEEIDTADYYNLMICLYRGQATMLSTLNLSKLPIGCLATDCFSNNTNIQEIELPKFITQIPKNCFAGCTKLERVGIPKGVTTLCAGCFVDCENLREVKLPQNVVDIAGSSFQYCKKLKEIELPKGGGNS